MEYATEFFLTVFRICFKRFNFLAPNVNIITHCDTAASLISQINKGELDLALTFNRGNYPASASTYPLKSDEIIFNR